MKHLLYLLSFAVLFGCNAGAEEENNVLSDFMQEHDEAITEHFRAEKVEGFNNGESRRATFKIHESEKFDNIAPNSFNRDMFAIEAGMHLDALLKARQQQFDTIQVSFYQQDSLMFDYFMNSEM